MPAVAEDLNKKFIVPWPSVGADIITALPSLRATILYPKSCSVVELSGESIRDSV